MIKWLEEVKMCDPNDLNVKASFITVLSARPGWSKEVAKSILIMMIDTWETWEADRLIMIAEKAEWSGRLCDDDPQPMCPICDALETEGHRPGCYYHEDFKL